MHRNKTKKSNLIQNCKNLTFLRKLVLHITKVHIKCVMFCIVVRQFSTAPTYISKNKGC